MDNRNDEILSLNADHLNVEKLENRLELTDADGGLLAYLLSFFGVGATTNDCKNFKCNGFTCNVNHEQMN